MQKPEVIFVPSCEAHAQLKLVVAKPASPGPYPTIIFNHGSTGSGTNIRLRAYTWAPPMLGRYFTERGWMVIFPQRRGRGRSGGEYLEGLRTDGRGYSCDIPIATQGFERALEDVESVMRHVHDRSDVKQNQIVLAGASRGGILSVAYAGLHPQRFAGCINFVGGWLGRACPSHEQINPLLFRRGATFPRPMLWIHGSYDQYYRVSHCRSNFAQFTAAGGQGKFLAARGGHALLFKPALWSAQVDEYLNAITQATNTGI